MRPLLLSFALLAALVLRAQAKPEQVQVFGQVTDAVTGKPVYECLVEHYDNTGKRWAVTTVNSDGQYALFIPVGVPFELRVVRENGYAPFSERHKAIRAGTKTFELPVKLVPRP